MKPKTAAGRALLRGKRVHEKVIVAIEEQAAAADRERIRVRLDRALSPHALEHESLESERALLDEVRTSVRAILAEEPGE